jgi:glycosyltransferase involved in cell wall biosynthesis
MRVLLVYPGLRPGGITTSLRQLQRGLRARGADVAVAGDLAQVLRSRGGDVVIHVYSSTPSATTFGTMALARARRLPLVWTPVFHPSRPGSWAGYGPLRALEIFDRIVPRAACLADGVITATAAEAELFRRLGARRVEISSPSVEKTAGRLTGAARAGVRASFGLRDQPTVLVVARSGNARRKGLPFARAVFRELRSRLPAAQLLLLGHEPGEELAREAGAVATGWCGPERVAAAYDAADVLLVASVYEQFSRAVIEAWSHELPVAVTDRVGLAPLVRGRAGKVAAFGDVAAMADALEAMLTDARLARDYGIAGRALVEQHFLEADHVDRVLAVYHAVSRR